MARRTFLTRTAAAAGAAAALMAVAGPAQARRHHTWYVGPNGQAAACAADTQATPFATLQAAVACAASGDIVVVAPSATPYPGLGEIGVNLTIEAAPGADARSVTVDETPLGGATPAPGALYVDPSASVTLSGMTLMCPVFCGAPLATNHGSLTLNGMTLTGGDEGGVVDVPVGGGPAAKLVVRNSTIVHNTSFTGGGVYVTTGGPSTQASADIADSTIADNTAVSGGGGGISVVGASTVSLTNVTVTGNHATGFGGGGGIATSNAGAVSASNTLIAGNTASQGPDCLGTLVDGDGGHDLLGTTSGCTGVADGKHGDITDVADAGLEPLADNGGPTDTVALQAVSPAVDEGDAATCQLSAVASRDQRGDTRSVKTRSTCDIGAYDTAGAGGTVHRTWYVGPAGAAASCAANSQATPFATLQAAVACAAPDDAVMVAPSAAPYPGIGPVAVSLTIDAAPGASARSVVVDESLPGDTTAPGELVVAPSASVVVHGITLSCSSQPCLHAMATNQGSLALDGSTVTGGYAGGVVDAAQAGGPVARLVVRGSAIVHNAAIGGSGSGQGGGVSVPGSGHTSLEIDNSTLSDNSAVAGGGLFVSAADAVSLTNVTITDNHGGQTGGGILSDTPGEVTLSNTLIAGNTASQGPDCWGALVDGPGGHNLLDVSTGCSGLAPAAGDLLDVGDAGVLPVANNGGPTDTSKLAPSSPAIGHADLATCMGAFVVSRDQRGSARRAKNRGTCDIGAYDTGGR